MRLGLLPAFCLVLACAQAAPVASEASRPIIPHTDEFPDPRRPVASIVSSHSGSEPSRDAAREGELTMDLLPLGEGVIIADIGAGDGYFTIRLARRLGESGQVILNETGRLRTTGFRLSCSAASSKPSAMSRWRLHSSGRGSVTWHCLRLHAPNQSLPKSSPVRIEQNLRCSSLPHPLRQTGSR